MRVRIVHETTYRYERPVRALVQVLRLTPRDHDGQHVLRWRIEPSVDGRLRRARTASATSCTCSRPTVPSRTSRSGSSARSRPRTPAASCAARSSASRTCSTCARPSLTAADDGDPRLRGRRRRRCGGRSRSRPAPAARRRAPRGRPSTPSRPMSRRPRAEAFALRRGVCQDLTHIFIAAGRISAFRPATSPAISSAPTASSTRMPGTPGPRRRCRDLGWVGFDPANGISVSEAHVRVAIGLDYLGAAPIRGSAPGRRLGAPRGSAARSRRAGHS